MLPVGALGTADRCWWVVCPAMDPVAPVPEEPAGPGAGAPVPVVPHYGGACLSSVVPALLGRHGGSASWVPEPARDARQVVLLALDGLGWEKLRSVAGLAPTLASGTGGPITSVAPTTTATALT